MEAYIKLVKLDGLKPIFAGPFLDDCYDSITNINQIHTDTNMVTGTQTDIWTHSHRYTKKQVET